MHRHLRSARIAQRFRLGHLWPDSKAGLPSDRYRIPSRRLLSSSAWQAEVTFALNATFESRHRSQDQPTTSLAISSTARSVAARPNCRAPIRPRPTIGSLHRHHQVHLADIWRGTKASSLAQEDSERSLTQKHHNAHGEQLHLDRQP